MKDEALDERIAIEVMGWEKPPRNQVGWVIHGKWTGLRHADWSPSSCREDAMSVIDHLRESNRFCCITIKSDFHYTWRVALTIDMTMNEPEAYEHKPDYVAEDESLMMAICKAALSAGHLLNPCNINA